jgi:hypothetical protein
MTLAAFKSAHGITTLNFYKSHSSSRHVAAFGTDKLLVTTEDFDSKKPAFVYNNPVGGDNSYILSNKEPKAADFTL